MFGPCILISEVLLLICGIIAIFTGKLPALVFGKKYRTEGNGARAIGCLLALPLPGALVFGVLLGILFGPEATIYAVIFEMALVILCLVAALLINVRVRQPNLSPTPPE
jgi:hypothetical protein